VTRFLAAFATLLARALGLARPLAMPPLSPHPVPLLTMASPCAPVLSLGLPGRYTPQTGGMP